LTDEMISRIQLRSSHAHDALGISISLDWTDDRGDVGIDFAVEVPGQAQAQLRWWVTRDHLHEFVRGLKRIRNGEPVAAELRDYECSGGVSVFLNSQSDCRLAFEMILSDQANEGGESGRIALTASGVPIEAEFINCLSDFVSEQISLA
jgi:hypothetical protein